MKTSQKVQYRVNTVSDTTVSVLILANLLFKTIHHTEKHGGCTFDHNSLGT